MTKVLEVSDLRTTFTTPEGEVKAVGGVEFTINQGEVLGVVGESGSGKSQIFMSIMGLLARNGHAKGSVKFKGDEILGLDVKALNKVRGVRMSMIFQDPMTSLNPYLSVRRQMTEVLVLHKGMSESEAAKNAVEMLERVQIPEAKQRLNMYPHEFSGGMRQRVMIAMALLCGPELLIADEPTTALDVTVQAQILELLVGLQRDVGMAIALITHDLGVIARLADRVMVMYAGNIVEKGSVRDLFKDPQHPYTEGLLESMPRLNETEATRLQTIGGQPPNLQNLPSGCSFRDRCRYAFERCVTERPLLTAFAEGRSKACHLPSL
ncbi:MAG TPA: oligopeptide/dipeptide ABC transporter ATP-binding protein [Candidatus Binatia bacterium]|nr:oligopeptide/dipeptide ABC transporter ATP-binding protein [Candidatus Binatia bacterium]